MQDAWDGLIGSEAHHFHPPCAKTHTAARQAVQLSGCQIQPGRTTMLAEIFMLRLEALLRASAANPTTTASDVRFVPMKLPPKGKPERSAA